MKELGKKPAHVPQRKDVGISFSNALGSSDFWEIPEMNCGCAGLSSLAFRIGLKKSGTTYSPNFSPMFIILGE